WGWLSVVTLIMVVLCGLPYVLAATNGRTDLERIGTFWFSRDFSQYEAAMRDGARTSGWLIHDHFSAEPHAAALMYPLYVGAGKVSAAIDQDPLAVFAVLEWIGRFAVLASVYVFVAAFARSRHERLLAVGLILGSLGLDAWALPLRLIFDG